MTNETTIDCSACEAQLFEFHEGKLSPDNAAAMNAHLAQCDRCSELLGDIWQMGLVASRWQDESVPGHNRPQIEDRHTRWGLPQIVATAASIIAVVLVLTDTRVVPEDGGFRVVVGTSQYVTQSDFENFSRDQRQQLTQLASTQVASDQLVLRSMLEASREERREDLTTLVSYLNAAQARQRQQTETDLRYLLASQAEDERDIQQLSQAFQLSLNPYTNTSGNDM